MRGEQASGDDERVLGFFWFGLVWFWYRGSILGLVWFWFVLLLLYIGFGLVLVCFAFALYRLYQCIGDWFSLLSLPVT